jgi:hypothetical protein
MKLPSLPAYVAPRNVRDNGAQIMMTLEMLKDEINNLDWGQMTFVRARMRMATFGSRDNG